MWRRALKKNLDFYFSKEKSGFLFFMSFFLVLKKFTFWEEDWRLGYNSMKFWDFPNISQVPKVLSLQLFGNSSGNWYIFCLLLTITLRFTCGERKICSNIKKSQRIMSTIVVLKSLELFFIFFLFLIWYFHSKPFRLTFFFRIQGVFVF